MTTKSPQAGPWTVRRLLDWMIPYLKDHGSESPRLDAETLLAHCWSCPRISLYTRFDVEVPEAVLAELRGLVKRRAKAEPVAYLVGYREFFSLNFEVCPGVLIPRPATETLVLEAIEFLKQTQATQVVDVCSGSGCVGIAIARQLKEIEVLALELDAVALQCTQRNIEKHQLQDRVTGLPSDLLQGLPADVCPQLIVSNPPYICTHEIETLDADVKHHEPHLALDGGSDGLDLVRRLIEQSSERLCAGGGLLMEIDPEQFSAVEAYLDAAGHWTSIARYKDLDGHMRVIKAVKR